MGLFSAGSKDQEKRTLNEARTDRIFLAFVKVEALGGDIKKLVRTYLLHDYNLVITAQGHRVEHYLFSGRH